MAEEDIAIFNDKTVLSIFIRTFKQEYNIRKRDFQEINKKEMDWKKRQGRDVNYLLADFQRNFDIANTIPSIDESSGMEKVIAELEKNRAEILGIILGSILGDMEWGIADNQNFEINWNKSYENRLLDYASRIAQQLNKKYHGYRLTVQFINGRIHRLQDRYPQLGRTKGQLFNKLAQIFLQYSTK